MSTRTNALFRIVGQKQGNDEAIQSDSFNINHAQDHLDELWFRVEANCSAGGAEERRGLVGNTFGFRGRSHFTVSVVHTVHKDGHSPTRSETGSSNSEAGSKVLVTLDSSHVGISRGHCEKVSNDETVNSQNSGLDNGNKSLQGGALHGVGRAARRCNGRTGGRQKDCQPAADVGPKLRFNRHDNRWEDDEACFGGCAVV